MKAFGVERKALASLSEVELRLATIDRRNAIRYHRDQRGDDRCWLDDYLVWAALEDSSPPLAALPGFEAMMLACRLFYTYRRAIVPDPVPMDAIIDPTCWDRDLSEMTPDALVEELVRVQVAIRTFRDLPIQEGRPHSISDDRRLYQVLPERLPADFRLPPEDAFLGTANSCAGCPNFWSSHQTCGTSQHNLRQWGLCGK